MKSKFVKPSLSAPIESAKKASKSVQKLLCKRVQSAVTMKNLHILIHYQDKLQLKFNETVLVLISRNQHEIETLKEEVKKLKNTYILRFRKMLTAKTFPVWFVQLSMWKESNAWISERYKCSSAFTTKKALKTHKNKDHKLIKCEQCKLTFEQEDKLKSHMKEQHILVSACQKVFAVHL